MKKIKINKSLITGLVGGFILGIGVFGVSASTTGTIGQLFFQITGLENGYDATGEYRLDGSNIKDETLTTYEILNSTIRQEDLGMDSVGSSQIIDSSILGVDLVNNSIGSSHIIDNSLTGNDIAANSISNSELDNSLNFNIAGLTVSSNVTASQYNLSSDRRYKKDIEGIIDPIGKIMGINGYSYTLKSNNKRDYGVIAQEVEEVFPELVNTDEAGYKSVQYMNLIAPMIEAMKQQQKQITNLEQRIVELEK